jgi:hypothetical protein
MLETGFKCEDALGLQDTPAWKELGSIASPTYPSFYASEELVSLFKHLGKSLQSPPTPQSGNSS